MSTLRSAFPFVATHGIEFSLDEIHGHKHTDDRTTGIEALSHIQTARGSLFWSHGEDVGVTRGLKERQPASHDEVGHEETAVDAYCLCGKEQKCACGIESEAHHYTSLVAVLADEDGSGECHAEITSVESHLHESTVSNAHPEDF